jgi:hypothetical protein
MRECPTLTSRQSYPEVEYGTNKHLYVLIFHCFVSLGISISAFNQGANAYEIRERPISIFDSF